MNAMEQKPLILNQHFQILAINWNKNWTKNNSERKNTIDKVIKKNKSSRLSDTTSRYSENYKTSLNFNQIWSNSSVNHSNKKEISLSTQKIKNMMTRQNFYNILQHGGDKIIQNEEIKWLGNSLNTLTHNNYESLSKNELFQEKLSSIIPLINQSEKFIENCNCAVKARKTLHKFQCDSTAISPRIKIDDEYNDYRQTKEKEVNTLVSPAIEVQEYYTTRKDRLYLKEISSENNKFDIYKPKKINYDDTDLISPVLDSENRMSSRKYWKLDIAPTVLHNSKLNNDVKKKLQKRPRNKELVVTMYQQKSKRKQR